MLQQNCLYNQTQGQTNAGKLPHDRCNVGSFLSLTIEAAHYKISPFISNSHRTKRRNGRTVKGRQRMSPAMRIVCVTLKQTCRDLSTF